jgi:protein-S-isoprenylcysteine O-methyltransferase Ste14
VEYLVLIILWAFWCFIHSGLISLSVSDYLEKRLGRNYRFYRLFYNLFAVITLIPPVFYTLSLKKHHLLSLDGYLAVAQWILLAFSAVLFICGAMKYDLRQFIGIRQIQSGKVHSSLSETGDLDTSGILNVTRHPWYLGAFLLVWAGNKEIYVSNLIVKVLLSGYLLIGTVLEEKKLVAAYGDHYKDYQKKVSMLFPVKWLVNKLSPNKNYNCNRRSQ